MNESNAVNQQLVAWLRDGPDRGRQQVLEEALGRSALVRQRPAWRAGGRWPSSTRLRFPEDARRRLGVVLLIGLLVVAIGAVAMLAGRPTPRGPLPIVFMRGGVIFVAAADGTNPVAMPGVSLGRGLLQLSLAPDGRHLAIVEGPNDGARSGGALRIVSMDGTPTASFAFGASSQVAWSPDGTRLAIQSSGSLDVLQIVNLDGAEVGRLPLPPGFQPGFRGWVGPMAWSPDGATIALAGCYAGCNRKLASDVIGIATDGSGAHPLSHVDDPGHETDSWMAWAPDGRLALARLCVEGFDCRAGTLLVRPGGHVERVPALEDLPAAWFAWSSDGRLAVATVAEPTILAAAVGLSVVDPNGGRTTLVGEAFHPITSPTWSFDDRSIQFGAIGPGESDMGVWSVAVDGGAPVELVPNVDVVAMVGD